MEPVKLQPQHPSFLVEVLDSNAGLNAERLVFGEHGRAGIPLFHGRAGVHLVSVPSKQRLAHLIVLGFGFLQPQHIWTQRFDLVCESLFDHGAKAVDVPTHQLHDGNKASGRCAQRAASSRTSSREPWASRVSPVW